MAFYPNTVLFISFTIFITCTFQQSPSPGPNPSPSPSPWLSPSPSPSPASRSFCCKGEPLLRNCSNGTPIEATCDEINCQWIFSTACPFGPNLQLCQCPINNYPQCGNATVVCLPKGTSCAYECDCGNSCSGVTPCVDAFCGFNQTTLSCQWVSSNCQFPLPSLAANCSAPGACGTASYNCSNGNAPKCTRTGLTCANVCPVSVSSYSIDCTGQCWGTPSCSNAKCDLAPVYSQSVLSGVTTTPLILVPSNSTFKSNFSVVSNGTLNSTSSNVNSSIVFAAQCQWSCPDQCTSWCSSYQCPKNTTLVSCGPNPLDISTCLPVCASTACSQQCQSLLCAVGTTPTCTSVNNTCSQTCATSSCLDPCAPNCDPICGLGGSGKPCFNSTCSLPSNYTLPSGSLYTPSLLSSCKWTPSLETGMCLTQPSRKCVGTPPCISSTCEVYANGSTYWDNSSCTLDCSLLSQSQCPGGFQDCTAGNGLCLMTGSSCAWTCPINPCTNSSGSPTCSTPAPTSAPFDSCISWTANCIVSNITASPPVCTWNVQCTQLNQTLTGPCNATVADCSNHPNTSCNGSEICLRISGAGPCQWLYSCPPDLTLQSPCSASDCQTLNTVINNSTTICGINPVAQSTCVRNSKGYCSLLSPCYLAYNPPTCQRSPCGDVCYDPRWLSGELVAPASFNATWLQKTTLNCSLCVRRCSGFLLCGRPSSNPICQFSQSTAYDQCMAQCNSTLPFPSILNPNTTTNSTAPQCSGNDPCNCNYTTCTYVIAEYSVGKYAACLPTQTASFTLSLPGVQTVYSSVTPPPYCLVLQYTNNTIQTTSALSLIETINSVWAASLQQDLLNQLNATSSDNFTSLIPQISAILVPSLVKGSSLVNSTSLVNGSSLNSLSLANSSSLASSWANGSSLVNGSYLVNGSPLVKGSSLVNIGIILTLTGNQSPNQTSLNEWCDFVLNVIANALQFPISQMGPCNLTPLAIISPNNGSLGSTVPPTGFWGTYALTSVANTSPESANETGWVPQSANETGWVPQSANGTGWVPQSANQTGSLNGTGIHGTWNGTTSPAPYSTPTITIPPIFPNLTTPGVKTPTNAPPISNGPVSPSGGAQLVLSVAVLLCAGMALLL